VLNNLYWKDNIVLYKHISKHIPEERNPAWKNLINAYFKAGLYEDALDEIKNFSSCYPDSVESYILWGNYYFLTGNLQKAVDNYKLALSKDRNNFAVYSNLSLFYKELNQLDKAIDSGLACFRINPGLVENLVRLGDLYSKKRQFSEADKYYYMALDIEPDNQSIKEKIKYAK
jgi:tetratricopeptide (TPR) repeat protein